MFTTASATSGREVDAGSKPAELSQQVIERLLFPPQVVCRYVHSEHDPAPTSNWSLRGDFTYTPLQSKNAIRLMVLQPGLDDKVKCKIIVTDLNDAPAYEAVSYVWGSSVEDSTIWCNKRKLSVTTNLQDALRTFRYAAAPRTLWIDRICINQQDLSERSAQVLQMRAIFRRASRVLAWLGPEDRQDRSAMKVIAKIGSAYTEAGYNDPNDLINVSNFQMATKRIAIDVPDVRSGGFQIWRAFFRFFEHPYFCRTWVIQEIQANSGCMAFCGNSFVDFSDIQFAALWALRASQEFGSAMFTDRGLSNAVYMRTLAVPGSTLLQRLEQTRGFFATDPRDKIFAFLRPEDPIPLRYQNPTWRVFLDASTQMLHKDGLDFLSYVFHNHESIELTSASFPSWIPTFSNSFFTPLHKLDRLHAGGHRRRQVFSIHGTQLHTKATKIGIIQKAYPRFTWGDFDIHFSPNDRRIYRLPVYMDWIWKEFVWGEKSKTLYSNGSSVKDAFSLTMTAGLRSWDCLNDFAAHRKAFSAFTEKLFKFAKTTFLRRQRTGHSPNHSLHTSMLCECFQVEKYDINIQGGTQAAQDPDHQRIAREAARAVSDYERFQQAARSVCNNRCLFVTEAGHIGLGPRGLSNGCPREWDAEAKVFPEMCISTPYEVWVIAGAKTPFVLQPCGNSFLLVGECYLHGFMEPIGDAVSNSQWKDVQLV